MVPRELWGARPWQLTNDQGSDGTTLIEIVGSPEGLVIIGRCAACGGRAEALADLRWITATSAPMPSVDAMIGSATVWKELRPAIGSVGQAMEFHRRCAQHPRTIQFTEPLQRFTDTVISESRKAMREAGEIPGHLHVLLETGGACALPFQAAIYGEPGSDERMTAAAVHLSRIRRCLRLLPSQVVGAVLTGEAWAGEVSEEEPEDRVAPRPDDREEVLLATVITPTAAKLSISPLQDLVDAAALGAGDMTWAPVIMPAPLTDGLFARSQCVIHNSGRFSGRSSVETGS